MSEKGRSGPLLLAGVMLLSLLGCELPTVKLDPSESDPIKRIALLNLYVKEVRVFVPGNVLTSFAISGRLSQGLRPRLVSATVETLQKELGAKGVDVVYLEGVSSRRPGKGEGPRLLGLERTDRDTEHIYDDYSQVTTDADAILHVWFVDIGYIGQDWIFFHTTRPFITARARLLDARTKTVLYAQSFEFGGITRLHWGEEHIPADKVPSDQFDSAEKIEQAREILLHGVREICVRIAQQLR